MDYQVQLDTFQGPLELLYQLIKKNEIEISEISLAQITGQYLAYMEEIKELDLDMASEFMIIAAELIELKAKTLLPQDSNQKDEKEDNEKDLVRRLQEYELFKKISGILQDYQKEAGKQYVRPDTFTFYTGDEDEIELQTELSELVEAFQKVMASLEDKEELLENKEEKWDKINVREIRIEDKSRYIMEKLAENPDGVTFKDLIISSRNRVEIVVTFLSILELVKMCKIKITQDKLFANISLCQTG